MVGTEARYDLKEAVADLAGAGLLGDVLLFRPPRWERVGVEAVDVALGFLGAGLDSRTVGEDALFVGLLGDHGDGRDFVGPALRAGAAAALTRPWDREGVDPVLSSDPGRTAAVLISDDPAGALAELAAAWRRRHATPAVGVTGSNGKTTTKDLLAALLGSLGETHATVGNFNNDLGLPLTLLGLREDHDWAVFEMGASGPGDIDRLAKAARPRVGVITNAAGAHLEGFGDLATVIAAKGELLDHLPVDGVAVLNRDSEGFREWNERAPCPVLSWGTGSGENRWRWLEGSTGGRLELDGRVIECPLPGRHNAANLVAAIVAARALAGRDLDIADGLAHLRTSPHRSRLLEVAGVTILDDSYNANPASVLAAATALADLAGDGRRVAVLGLMAELGRDSARRHRETGGGVIEAGVDAVWTLGTEAAELARGARDAGGEGRDFDDVDALAAALAADLAPGDKMLIKGSRSAAMERVLDAYRRRREPGAAPGRNA